MLRRLGEKEWIQQEIKDIKELNFRFLSKSSPSSYATTLANNMQLYPPEHIVSVSVFHFFHVSCKAKCRIQNNSFQKKRSQMLS